MYHVSNHVLCVLNLSLFLTSIPIMAISTTTSNIEKIECVAVVQQPMLVIGILLFLVSVMGILSCCLRFPSYLWFYLFFLLLLMVGIFCFTMFLYLVTDDKFGLSLQDTGFMKSKHASGHPSWLQTQVGNGNKWVKIRDCMRAGQVCTRAPSDVPLTLSIYGHDLFVLQGGCCTPPPPCGFIPINATSWSSEGRMHPLEHDCKKWSNDPGVLCYECETCKGAIIQNMRNGWRRMTAATFCILVVLNVIFAVGSCAYKNLKLDKYPNQIYHH